METISWILVDKKFETIPSYWNYQTVNLECSLTMDTLGLKIGNFCKKWMKTTNLQYKFDCKLKLSIICIIPFNMLNSGLALFIFTCIWLLISWFIKYKGAWTINKDNIHQWEKRFRHYKKQKFFFQE